MKFHRIRSGAVMLAVAGAMLANVSAHAAPITTETYEPTVAVIQDPTNPGPTMPQPTSGPVVIAVADLNVDYLGSNRVNNTVTYQFKVKNVGTGNAKDVKLWKNVVTNDFSGSNGLDNTMTNEYVGTMAPGQEKMVTLTCQLGSAPFICSSSVEAKLSNYDKNPGNNWDTSETTNA